jgi:hypothetical protein
MFVSLAVGVGTALKLENVQDVGRKHNVDGGFFAYNAWLHLDSDIGDGS